MDIKELRIGNIILAEFGMGYDQIETVDAETFTRFTTDHVSFSGVELTEGWLIKLGLVINNSGGSFIIKINSEDRHLYIIQTKQEFYPYLHQAPEMSFESEQLFSLNYIKYVHQLQNLYFVLTGEELQIAR